MDKFTRLVKTLPSFYRAETSIFLRGLLQAWGISDDEIEVQIREAKDQLFVQDASGRFLDRNANDFGVDRNPELGIEDEEFRQLVPVLSTFPKQVRNTIISLLDVFWGPGFTHANINSGNIQPFDFGAPTGTSGTFSFKKGDRLVKGIGSAFLAEIQPGNYLRPTSATDRDFARVSRVLSNEELELSIAWPNPNIALIGAVKANSLTLTYRVDNSNSKIIRFAPNSFDDLTAIRVQELADFINGSVEHSAVIDASVFLDPTEGNKLNLRTKTPGLQGAIQITGGTANSPALNFSSDIASEVKAAIFEIVPNEIVVKLPSTVPILRRSLKGSAHPKGQKTEIVSGPEVYNFSTLGASSELEVEIDGNSSTVNFNHALDFEDSERVTAREVVNVINNQLIFLRAFTKEPGAFRSVGLRTTDGAAQYEVTGGSANLILQFTNDLQTDPDVIIDNFPSSYIFDPTGQLFTVRSISSTLTTLIGEGSLLSTILLDDTSEFPNNAGLLLFDFGRNVQEGPVAYSSRPNNSSLIIDAAHIFQKTHLVGRNVNLILNRPTIPRVTGDDLAVFITGTQEARLAAQTLIRRLIAAGVVIRFQISFPEVLFECKITVPESPEFQGLLTGSLNPLFNC